MVRVAPLLCALLAVSCSLFDYSGVVTHRYALVYGVTRYATAAPSGSYPNLSYPALDAQDVAAMLTAEGYAVKSRWVDDAGDVYVDGALVGPVDSNVASAPTRGNVQNDLAALAASIGPTDQFVLYFSGHGMQNADATHEFFVPYGGIVKIGPDYYGDEAGSVRDDELGGWLTSSIATPRRVVILDTCNSGGFIANTLEVDLTPDTTNPIFTPCFSLSTIAKAISAYATFTTTSANGVSPYQALVLSAAGAGESSYDDAGHAHGAMTWYFLQTAASGDLNGDRLVTVLEAFSLVKAGIEENWNAAYPADAFTPHVSGGPVDFVLF
jgi:hypothetical protein